MNANKKRERQMMNLAWALVIMGCAAAAVSAVILVNVIR